MTDADAEAEADPVDFLVLDLLDSADLDIEEEIDDSSLMGHTVVVTGTTSVVVTTDAAEAGQLVIVGGHDVTVRVDDKKIVAVVREAWSTLAAAVVFATDNWRLSSLGLC